MCVFFYGRGSESVTGQLLLGYMLVGYLIQRDRAVPCPGGAASGLHFRKAGVAACPAVLKLGCLRLMMHPSSSICDSCW